MMKINDRELASELKGMRITSWESRYTGKGRKKLYIRLEPNMKAVKVRLSK